METALTFTRAFGVAFSLCVPLITLTLLALRREAAVVRAAEALLRLTR